MEEDNPWLDPEAVKHINKKSVRLEPKVIPEIKPEIKSEKKRYFRKKDVKDAKEVKDTKNIPLREKIDKEREQKEEIGIVNINEIDKENVKIVKFLDVLLSEFTIDIPQGSKEWAIENFGTEWLKSFLEDVENLKFDLINSRFFPSRDKMIFLKYIFLLQQSF